MVWKVKLTGRDKQGTKWNDSEYRWLKYELSNPLAFWTLEKADCSIYDSLDDAYLAGSSYCKLINLDSSYLTDFAIIPEGKPKLTSTTSWKSILGTNPLADLKARAEALIGNIEVDLNSKLPDDRSFMDHYLDSEDEWAEVYQRLADN